MCFLVVVVVVCASSPAVSNFAFPKAFQGMTPKP